MTDPQTTIKRIVIFGPIGESCEEEWYQVGQNDVSEIRLSERCGSMAMIPYLEVWKNGKLHAEFCQHNIQGVYYD